MAGHHFLTTYLNDHLAGSQMALEVVDLLRKIDDSSVWQEIETEIKADREELRRIMQLTHAVPSSLRKATAWAAEKLAELKTTVDDPSDDGALRRLELIEALALGIDGKRALWTALQSASARMPDLRSVDYPHLLARTDAQRGIVELRRLQAALEALAETPTDARQPR